MTNSTSGFTLGNYRHIAATLFGEDSKAVKWIEDKIANSPKGSAELVLADEAQMLAVLIEIHYGE